MVEIESCLFAKIIWIIIKFRRIWNFHTLDLYKFCCAVEPPMLCFVRYRADEILWNLTTLRLLEWSWSSWYNFHVYTTVKRETYKHVFRYLEIKISVLILILDGLNTALRKKIGLSETMNRWNFWSMHQKHESSCSREKWDLFFWGITSILILVIFTFRMMMLEIYNSEKLLWEHHRWGSNHLVESVIESLP